MGLFSFLTGGKKKEAKTAPVVAAPPPAKSTIVETKAEAALALASTGKRKHLLSLKQDYDDATDLVRTAIALACKKLPPDEYQHWRKLRGKRDLLERVI